MTLPAQAQKVKVQHDPAADFSQFQTYAWKLGTSAPHPGTHQLIRDSVEEKLTGKGFRQQAEGQTDFYVIYHVAMGGGVSAPYYEYQWVDATGKVGIPLAPGGSYLEGTLVVDIVDGTGKQLLWRGVATSTIEGGGEKLVTKVQKAVEKMFKGFPPQKRK